MFEWLWKKRIEVVHVGKIEVVHRHEGKIEISGDVNVRDNDRAVGSLADVAEDPFKPFVPSRGHADTALDAGIDDLRRKLSTNQDAIKGLGREE